ncbi:MAG: RdgB/HAM1 family non-canonical purine NTP pyrophosphatase [Arenicella sp.]|nr:RdgB/HAM1 family non-canonical purine NTP pyrophosphatase [Arenicella sp.]
MPTIVVLATSNAGKLSEIQRIVGNSEVEFVPQSQLKVPDAIEDGLSFVENAIIKARNACHHTNLPAIADDSGLEVAALRGAPGIYSSRYADGAGDLANNEKLLQVMEGRHDRAARFVCVMVYMHHAEDPTPLISYGFWEGQVANRPAGENGFGYDPLFYVPELNCHSAELDSAVKNRVSHRAKALANLKAQLEQHKILT